MLNALQTRARHAFRVVIAMAPWLVSMYTLYWLEHGEIWTTETAHRGKISVTILVLGMTLSFFIMSRFAAKKEK